jgi:hypothetical protein
LKQIIKKLYTIVEIDRERKQDSTIYVGCMCWLVAIIVTVGPFCEIPARPGPFYTKPASAHLSVWIYYNYLRLIKVDQIHESWPR